MKTGELFDVYDEFTSNSDWSMRCCLLTDDRRLLSFCELQLLPLHYRLFVILFFFFFFYEFRIIVVSIENTPNNTCFSLNHS
ncbi:hypothetical protein PGB90_007392 [Kerria lacca]